MRMTPLFNAQDTHVDGIDIAVFATMAGLCGYLFFQGGVAGFVGAIAGAVVGWRRPLNPLRPLRSMFKASLAGMWGGIMIGGMVATAASL